MLEILWEDEHLMAVAKPAGLATVPGRGVDDSVLDRLTAAGRPVRIVHRLDQQTSGVLLLAKDRDAQRHLCWQFMQRSVQKEYLAIVAGIPSQNSGTIDAKLARHPKSDSIAIVSRHGQEAVTRWEVAQRLGDLTLLRCRPSTGRMHQIRIHLKSIGLPLAVDPVYNRPHDGGHAGIFLSSYKRGYRKKASEERPLIARLTLHAFRVNFHNLDDRPISVTCPPPKDFSATIAQLLKLSHARPGDDAPAARPRRRP